MSAWAAVVRLGFRLLYNELALTYDVVSWVVSAGAWRCWVRASLSFLPPSEAGIVLELAHGTGNLQIDLYNAGYRAIGLDLSAAMGRIAAAKLRRPGIPIPLVRGRVQTLPFADATFSSVVSTFPTDFIVDPLTLRECFRVLSPGGALVIVPNAILTSRGWLSSVLEWLYRITGQRGGSTAEPDVRVLFSPYGFDATVHQVECPRSQVTVIVARKPS